MSDLRREAWLFDDVSSDRSIAALFKKEAVTDIMVWIQCYCPLYLHGLCRFFSTHVASLPKDHPGSRLGWQRTKV